MNDDDPRHGSRAGYYAHRRAAQSACPPCKRAAAAMEQRYVLARIRGRTGRVPAIGTKRRLRALQALGWTLTDLAAHMDSERSRVEKWCNEDKTYVYATTAARVATVYAQLSMSVPEGRWATRTRNHARRHGYVPPLAWDNIDDPDEQPRGWPYTQATRIELLTDLDRQGATLADALRLIGVDRKALERWCDRKGHRPLYNSLTRRQRGEAA